MVMPKQIFALAMVILTCCSAAMATPITVDPSVLDHLMSSYHVEYRVIGQLMLPGEDFEVHAAEQAGYHVDTYQLGTSIEWTPDGGQHDYLTTVFNLGDKSGIDGLVWLTDISTGVMTAEGYGALVMYPVTATNLLEASDLVLRQLDNIALSGPNGPLSTAFVTTRGGAAADLLPDPWPSLVPEILPSLVPEPSTLALAALGGLALLTCLRRRPRSLM